MEKPTPRDDQVLIRIHATTVTSGDVRARKADPFIARFFLGLRKPKRTILGSDLAGTIEEVGRDVERFKGGEEVFGPGVSTYAEYTCLLGEGLRVLKPANVPFGEAAAVPFGAMSSLFFLRRGNIQRDQKVLIYGASGALGTAAVQLAKYFGAEVTGVCSTANLDLVKSLGADHVIDYTREDFTNPAAYDLIFDTVGKSSSFRSMRSLKKGGVYASAVALAPILRRLWASMTGKKFVGGIMKETMEELRFLKEIIEAGKLRMVIDRTYPLERIAEAHGYVERGHKKGNVVITVEHGT